MEKETRALICPGEGSSHLKKGRLLGYNQGKTFLANVTLLGLQIRVLGPP